MMRFTKKQETQQSRVETYTSQIINTIFNENIELSNKKDLIMLFKFKKINNQTVIISY